MMIFSYFVLHLKVNMKWNCLFQCIKDFILQFFFAGKVRIVQDLLKNHTDVNAKDNKGRTPLTYAAREGYYFYLFGFEFKWIIIMNCLGHENIVKLLIENGADIDTQDEYGIKALHYAVYKGICNIFTWNSIIKIFFFNLQVMKTYQEFLLKMALTLKVRTNMRWHHLW